MMRVRPLGGLGTTFSHIALVGHCDTVLFVLLSLLHICFGCAKYLCIYYVPLDIINYSNSVCI